MNRKAGTSAVVREIVLPLGGIVAGAFALRLVAWSRTAILFNDGPVFLAIARAMEAGRWSDVFAHPYHPLYPFFVRLISALGLTLESAAVVVSALGGCLGIIALFVVLKRVFDIEIAWLGAWILALHPWAVDFSSDVMSDGLYLGLYLSCFAGLVRFIEWPSPTSAVVCGGFAVLAFLVRPEGIGLLIVCGVLVVARSIFDPRYRRVMTKPFALLLIVSALGLGPYVGWLSYAAGELTLTQKKSLASLASGDALPSRTMQIGPDSGPQISPLWLPQSAAPPGVGRPSRDAFGALEAVTRVVRTAAAGIRYEVLLMVVVGAVWLRTGRASIRSWNSPWVPLAFVLPVVLYSGILVLLVWGAGYVSRRHALPALVPLVGLAALAWRSVAERIYDRLALARPAPATESGAVGPRRRMICLALVLVLSVAWLPRDFRERRIDRLALRNAGEWLASNHPDSGSVAAEKLRIAYYAKSGYVPLRIGDDSGFIDGLRGQGARWVVLDRDRLHLFPQLAAADSESVEIIHREVSAERGAVVIDLEPAPAR